MANRLVVVLVVVAAILAAWLVLLGGAQQLGLSVPMLTLQAPASAAFVQSFELENAQNMLVYRDVYYGFDVNYPIGYYAQQDLLPGTRVQFSATTFDASESIEIAVVNRTPSVDELQNLEAGFPEGTLLDKRKETIGGRTAYLVNYETQPLEGSDEKVYVKQAVFTGCTDVANKEHIIILTAAVPQQFYSDLQLVDYMIYSFRCRS